MKGAVGVAWRKPVALWSGVGWGRCALRPAARCLSLRRPVCSTAGACTPCSMRGGPVLCTSRNVWLRGRSCSMMVSISTSTDCVHASTRAAGAWNSHLQMLGAALVAGQMLA